MKRILLFFLFLYVLKANAQNKTLFDDAVDYCNCKITDDYLNRKYSDKPDSKFKTGYNEKIRPAISNPEIGSALKYAKLTELMSEDFKETDGALSNKINAIKDQYQPVSDYNDAATQLVNEVYAAIPDYANKIDPVLRATLQFKVAEYFKKNNWTKGGGGGGGQGDLEEVYTRIDSLDRRIQVLEKQSMTGNVGMLVLSLLVIATGVFFWLRYKKLWSFMNSTAERLNTFNTTLSRIQSLAENSSSDRGQDAAAPKLKKYFEDKISEIHVALQRLQAEETAGIAASADSFNASRKAVEPAPMSKMDNKPKKVLYAPVPNKDGSFTNDAVSAELNPTASFYKFTLEDGSFTKASFEFLNEERAVKDATNAPERVLLPVCKITNALNQNAKRIVTDKPGIVVKKNDKWVLDTPAEIRYEQ